MRTCPKCSLVNPDSAIVCDCGHVLDADAAKSLPAASLRPPADPARRQRSDPGLALKIFIGLVGYFFAGLFFSVVSAALKPLIVFPFSMTVAAGIAGAVIALTMVHQAYEDADGRAPRTGRGRNYVSRHWRGELSLPVSYWVNGWIVAVVSICAITIGDETAHDVESRYASLLVDLGGWIVVAVGEVWFFVGTWRSSDRPTAGGWISSWSGLTKAVLVLGAMLLVAFAVARGWPIVRSRLEHARAVTQALQRPDGVAEC
jgi:hypothetical protein